MNESLVFAGEMTLDEVVFESGSSSWQAPGGGALYAALGARLWGVNPTISAVIGDDYPSDVLLALSKAGVDVSRVTRIGGPGLRIRLIHDSDNQRHQVPSTPFRDVDGRRPPWSELGLEHVEGVHVAPQSIEGQIRELMEIRRCSVGFTTVDIMFEPYFEVATYRTGEALIGATALLLTEAELREIWTRESPPEIRRQLDERAGVTFLVVKQGARGAMILTKDRWIHVPALSQHVVDTTGAGDAFSGGFLAGLLRTGDPIEASLRGAVSASFVIEGQGSLPMLERLDEHGEAASRLAEGRRRLAAVA